MHSRTDTTVLTLPAAWYHETAVWEAERRAIFAQEWLWVGREEQISEPGRYLTAEPAGFPVFLWRDPQGTLRVFHNVCRHRAMKLLRAEQGSCKQPVCPYHGWRYDADGSLLQAPRFEPANDFQKSDYGLYPLRVASWQGLLFICMDENTPEFEDWFGPLKERIDEYLQEERAYHGELGGEVVCNWKNYVDNYQEGYHIPLVHPQLAQDTMWQDYRVINVDGGSLHQVPPRGDSGQPGLFGWRFPNFMFNTYGQGVSFMRIEPIGPSRCHIHYSHFRPRGMDPCDYEKEVVGYGWEISEEDQAITPLVQQNLKAGVYRAGPLSPRHENGLMHFHEMVRSSLCSDPNFHDFV